MFAETIEEQQTPERAAAYLPWLTCSSSEVPLSWELKVTLKCNIPSVDYMDGLEEKVHLNFSASTKVRDCFVE